LLVTSLALAHCGSGAKLQGTPDAGNAEEVSVGSDAARERDAGGKKDSGGDANGSLGDGASDTGSPTCTGVAGDGGSSCYDIICTTNVHSLADNRDRLIDDLARRKCADRCTLWAALNEAERYIFLMDTAYLGSPESLLYPPGSSNLETALDHAVALYTINGPKAGQGVLLNGLGGNDYNRIYVGFDALAICVMRNFTIANPTDTKGYNEWVKSDDLAGPHAPFTQRDMIP
jgi:hypothetical protein